MEDKKWKVKYKKIPDDKVYQFGLAVLAKTEEEARRLTYTGVAKVNLKNEEVEEIEIVSCVEIK